MLSVEKKATIQKKVDINFFSSMSRFQRPLFISTSIKNCFFANGGNFFFAEVGESPERNCEKARPRISDAPSKSRQKKSIPRNLDSSSTLSVGRPLFCWLIYQRLQRWRELGPLSLSLSLSLPLSHSLSLAGLSRRTAKNLTATKLKDCFLFGVRSAKKLCNTLCRMILNWRSRLRGNFWRLQQVTYSFEKIEKIWGKIDFEELKF